MEKPDTIRSVLGKAYGTSQYWKVFPDLFITDGLKMKSSNVKISSYFSLHSKQKMGKSIY